jgi:hypothetical protein
MESYHEGENTNAYSTLKLFSSLRYTGQITRRLLWLKKLS